MITRNTFSVLCRWIHGQRTYTTPGRKNVWTPYLIKTSKLYFNNQYFFHSSFFVSENMILVTASQNNGNIKLQNIRRMCIGTLKMDVKSRAFNIKEDWDHVCDVQGFSPVRSSILTLIELRGWQWTWGNFLVFSYSQTQSHANPRGWGYIFIAAARQQSSRC